MSRVAWSRAPLRLVALALALCAALALALAPAARAQGTAPPARDRAPRQAPPDHTPQRRPLRALTRPTNVRSLPQGDYAPDELDEAEAPVEAAVETPPPPTDDQDSIPEATIDPPPPPSGAGVAEAGDEVQEELEPIAGVDDSTECAPGSLGDGCGEGAIGRCAAIRWQRHNRCSRVVCDAWRGWVGLGRGGRRGRPLKQAVRGACARPDAGELGGARLRPVCT